MKNQSSQKAANDENEDGNRLKSKVLSLENELLYQVEENLVIPLFKLGKTEEEILIDFVRKLSIPTNSLNTIRSPFKQN